MEKLVIFFLSLIFFINFVLINIVVADDASSSIVSCENISCDWTDLSKTIQNFLGKLVLFSFYIAFLMSIIGAFLMMFAGPRPSWYQRGVNLIKIAITGYILILISGLIFDIILDFFKPKFQNTAFIPILMKVNFVLATDNTETDGNNTNRQIASLTPEVYYRNLRDSISSALRCGSREGGMPTSSFGRLVNCISEILDFLKNLALIFLALAIIISGAYLVSVPILGFENIKKAWKILLWSIIGLIVILTADVIKEQIIQLFSSQP